MQKDINQILTPEGGQGGFQNFAWKLGGDTRRWASHQKRKYNQLSLLDSDKTYKTTWAFLGDAASKDLWSTGATASAYKHRNFQKSDSGASWQKAVEVLDLGAYDKDAAYGTYLTDHNLSNFSTIDQIHAAEDWIFGGGKARAQQAELDERNAANEALAQEQIDELRNQFRDYATQDTLNNVRSALESQISDLADRGIEIADISGLEDQLSQFSQTAQERTEAGDAQLANLIEQYRSQAETQRDQLGSNLRSEISDDLAGLRTALQGQFTQGIESLDIEGLRESLQGAKGDLTQLSSEFAGLGDDLRDSAQHAEQQRDLLRQQLASSVDMSEQQRAAIQQRIDALSSTTQNQYTQLSDRLSSGLTDLEGTFSDRITDVRQELGDNISQLSGQQTVLGHDLEGIRESLGDYQESTRDEFSDLRSELGEQWDRSQDQVRDIYRSRDETINALTSEFGQNLQEQERRLGSHIDERAQQLDDRLTRLVSSMNYRTLGNTALGIKARRSQAYESGATRRGTGQLSRAQVSTLNIA